MIELLVKKLHKDAKLPTKAHPGEDAAFDIYSIEDISLSCDCRSRTLIVENMNLPKMVEIHTGIAISVPNNYYVQVMCRSGLGRKGLKLHLGILDAGYRNEVTILGQNCGTETIQVKKGDRVAQLLILPVPDVKVVEVNELPKSERGNNGFGSSGR